MGLTLCAYKRNRTDVPDEVENFYMYIWTREYVGCRYVCEKPQSSNFIFYSLSLCFSLSSFCFVVVGCIVAALKFEQHKLFKRFVTGWWVREWRLVNPNRVECYFTVIMLFVKKKIRFVKMFRHFLFFFLSTFFCRYSPSFTIFPQPHSLCFVVFFTSSIRSAVEFSCCCFFSRLFRSMQTDAQSALCAFDWPNALLKMKMLT